MSDFNMDGSRIYTRRWDNARARYSLTQISPDADRYTGMVDVDGKLLFENDFVVIIFPKDLDKPYLKERVVGHVKYGPWSREYEVDTRLTISLSFYGVYLDGLYTCDDEFYDGQFLIVGNTKENPEMEGGCQLTNIVRNQIKR